MRIEGSNVLVTGGSRGLGASLARTLAKRGARVVVSARGGADAEGVAASIREAGGVAHALRADMADDAAVYPLVGSASALVGPIDVVIHNASVPGPVPLRPLVDTESVDFTAVLEANLLGPFRLTQALLGSMALRDRGVVVAITSDAGVAAYPGWGAYGVSKAGLDQLMRIWAVEFEGTGVKFLTLDPGEMDTQMHADVLPDADRSTLASPDLVAERIGALLESGSFESGARLSLGVEPEPGASR